VTPARLLGAARPEAMGGNDASLAGFRMMRMRGEFYDEEPEPVRSRRDTELTLGSGALLAIFLGLAFVCVFCFGFGYTVGHHSAPPAAALPAPSQPIAGGNSLAKPSATAQAEQVQTADADGSAQTAAAAATGANAAPGAPAVPTAAPSAAPPGEPAVHPALSSAAAPGQPAPAAPAASVAPAMAPAAPAPAGTLMVQIAAVSQVEDANVLADALRKRGYAVTARRDPTDNLIHVRIGPFSTLAEANSWKMKLLSDGYNAVVQQ
jgi:DedD protein